MIDGVVVSPLKQIHDERGKVMHMLRADMSDFEGFGEIYFSTVNPSVIKAWKKHRAMVQRFAVPIGEIKLVLYDERAQSSSFGKLQVLALGETNYCLVRIPPQVVYGFQGLSTVPALIANCTNLGYDENEVERFEAFAQRIPYQWNVD